MSETDEQDPLPPLSDEEQRRAYFLFALVKGARWDEVHLYVRNGEVKAKGVHTSDL